MVYMWSLYTRINGDWRQACHCNLFTTLVSFVKSAAGDFEYCNWSVSMTILCPLVKVLQGCCHSCRFQSSCHLGRERIADQRRFHFPLLCSSRTLSSFAAVFFPPLLCFHTTTVHNSFSKYAVTHIYDYTFKFKWL